MKKRVRKPVVKTKAKVPRTPVKRNGVTKCTYKEERFCKEYIKHGNGSKASRDSEYSEGHHAVNACALLKKPHIKQRIKELTADREYRTQVTADRTIREQARIAFANHDEIAKHAAQSKTIVEFLNSLSTDDACAIESVRLVVVQKFKPKRPARLNKAGKVLREEVPEVPEKKAITYVLHDKQKALDMLSKVQGLFIIKHSHSDDTPAMNGVRVEDLGLTADEKKNLLQKIRDARSLNKKEKGD